METIAKRIKQIRGMMTQKEFAARLGITPQAVINYELHGRHPKGSVIKALCDTFGINETWLLSGTGAVHKEEPEPMTCHRNMTSIDREHTENIDVASENTSDTSEVLRLQSELALALKGQVELQERLMTTTQENAELRVQAERQLSRIRELERENAEIPALKARIAELERELSERPKLPKTVPVDVSAKSKPTPAHGAGTDTAVVPGTGAGVSGMGNLGAVVRRNGE